MKLILTFLVISLISGIVSAESVTPLLKKGEISPTFMLPSITDQRVSLRDFCGPLRQSWKNGKQHIVIISFMASYCVPCRREIPQMEKYALTKEEDVKIIYISIDTLERSALLPFVEKVGIKQELLLDRYGSIMKKYGVQKLPSLFILNKDGAICYQNLDGLAEDVDFVALLKKEVAKVRAQTVTSPAPIDSPVKNLITSQNKQSVLSGILKRKSYEDISRETGVQTEDIEEVKREIDSTMRAKWGN